MTAREHRGTIFVEDATLLSQQEFPGRQFVIRLRAPQCAAAATPGSFAHLTCDPLLPMRRPLSIQRADATAGWIEILYKIVGPGLEALSKQPIGATISVMGPIGQGFRPSPARPRTLLVGGGVGIPPMVFLAESLKGRRDAPWQPLVLMGSEIPFPFRARPSTILLPGMPDGVIACMPLLDDWGVPSRLATLAGFPGCFDGYVTDLAATWLALARCAGAERGRDVRVRPDADAAGDGAGGAPLRRALPGVARGIHGLRGRRLRRLRGASGYRIRARDEARLRRRTGVRRERGVPAGGVALHCPSRTTHDSGQDFSGPDPGAKLHRGG